MTITSNITRNEYTASAGQTVFTYTFRIFEDGDISAFVTPAGQEADDSVDEVSISSVTGVGDEDGGTITIAATSADDKVTIVSNIAQDRETDYQTNGDFSATVVNLDFDKTVSLVKQLSDEISRSLKFQTSEQDVSGLTLPAPEAESVLQWKTDLSGLQNFPIPDLSDLTDGGDTALHYHSADRARAVHTGTQTAATISDFDTEVTNNATVAGHSTKLGYITVSQAVDLDVMEDNQTHTGDVTGSKVLTIADDAVTIAKLSATGTPSSSTYHRGDDVWTSLPTAATISDAAYSRSGWDGDTTDAASKNALSDTFYNMVRYLDADTGGSACVFIGGTTNTTNTGTNNVFGGPSCAASNTLGLSNSFYGSICGFSNTEGNSNSFYGYASGYGNTLGDFNCFYGNGSGQNTNLSDRNNAFGYRSLFSMALAGGDSCAFGTHSLFLANSALAVKNCAFGNYALDALTEGYEWVAVGFNAATAVTTGFGGISVGSESGVTVTTADDTLSIGRGVSAANIDNAYAIGRTDSGNAFMSGRMVESGGTIGIKATPWYENVLGNSIGLSVNGSFAIEFTNNTTITLRGLGSDGTTRTGTVTLS